MLQNIQLADEHLFGFFYHWDRFLPTIWKFLAVFGIYLIPFILIWFWFARRREPALFAFLAGIIAWEGVNNLVSHVVHRLRPVDFYHLALPTQEGLFHRPGSSFPSDHTAFIAALATIFLLYHERRVAFVIVGLGFVTVLARVVVGFHWPGDILAGAAVGTVTALALWLIRRPIERWVISPLVVLARKMRL